MAIYLRIIRSNSVVPEEREFRVQASTTGEPGTWGAESEWFQTRAKAVEFALEALGEHRRLHHRRTHTVVESYSGETG